MGIQEKVETVFLFLQAFVREEESGCSVHQQPPQLTGIDRLILHTTLKISQMIFVCAHKGFSAL